MEKYKAVAAQKMLSLNNDISAVNQELERIRDEISNTKSQAADVSQVHRNQRSKLSQVILAVNNIHEKCCKKGYPTAKSRQTASMV